MPSFGVKQHQLRILDTRVHTRMQTRMHTRTHAHAPSCPSTGLLLCSALLCTWKYFLVFGVTGISPLACAEMPMLPLWLWLLGPPRSTHGLHVQVHVRHSHAKHPSPWPLWAKTLPNCGQEHFYLQPIGQESVK